MVYSFVKRKQFSTAISNNSYRKLCIFIFISKQVKGEGGKRHFIHSKKGGNENSLVLYCSDNTQMKKIPNISQNIFRIYKYKKAL